MQQTEHWRGEGTTALLNRQTPHDGALRAALNRARQRASRKGWAFGLTLDGLRAMWWQQGGRCALSGLAFHDEVFPAARVRKPFAPSLDRDDNAFGYTPKNIRLVCAAVNFARGQWGDDVLRQIAHGIVQTERDEERAWYTQQKVRLAAAQTMLSELSGEAHRRQKRVIAGLKASLTKGPSRLRSAGRRASKRRQANG